jgi:glycosyltransferase involved in cell wall biosynthesis
MISVLGLMSKWSGCGWHRVMLPLAFLPDSYNHVTNIPTEELFKERQFNILLFNRFCFLDKDWSVSKEHFKIVMDLDDDWELPVNHPMFHLYKLQEEKILNNIQHADLVTVTNQRLFDKVSKFHHNVSILPNAIPLGEQQYTDDKVESDAVRIFWCGGSSHLNDMSILRNPIKRLHELTNIEMVLGGFTDTDPISKDYWDKMLSIFSNGKQLKHRTLPGTMPNDYMQMYKHADIMLIPLENSQWHGCKSNLKILEAASKRIPCIVSNVEPYNVDADCPVLWVNKQSDWFKNVKFLVNNPIERIKLGEQLYEWAKEKYNYQEISQRRFEAYSNLIEA